MITSSGQLAVLLLITWLAGAVGYATALAAVKDDGNTMFGGIVIQGMLFVCAVIVAYARYLK